MAVLGLLYMTKHFFRIFNSWVEAFEVVSKDGGDYTVKLTGTPFNDTYRYVNWLLTVPLLLIELILVMKLPKEETVDLACKMGVNLPESAEFLEKQATTEVQGLGLAAAVSGCREPCVGCTVPDRGVLVHLPLRVHHQERGPGRLQGHHVRADRLLHC